MTRLLILATILLSVVSYVSAQIVDTLNTPIGPVTQGANVAVSWTLVPGVDATGKNGDLSATDSATKNVIEINQQVPLAPKTFTWNVQVPPGTYVLGLNDGSGLKQSGEVVVKAPAGGAPAPGAPAPGAPAPGAPPAAPAPGASAPAPAPSAGKTPASSAPASSSPSAAPPAAGSTPSTPTTLAGASSSSSSSSSSSPATTATGSASSIFSGYEVVFSLLGVAIAMVQF